MCFPMGYETGYRILLTHENRGNHPSILQRFRNFCLHQVMCIYDQPTTEHANSFSDRDFSVAGLRIWNDLSPELRHADISFGQFRNMLKSYLFWF